MSNLPAWAKLAAQEIHSLDDHTRTREQVKEMAAIIARHAPDAESLAVVLEDQMQAGCNCKNCVSWRAVLATYRAAHPKQSSTDSPVAVRIHQERL